MKRHGAWLFSIAALFNLTVGLTMLLALPQLADTLQLTRVEGSNGLLLQIAAVLIITFGCAYGMIAANARRYYVYIYLGILGKLLVVSAAVPVIYSGGEGYLLAWLAMGDLLFALLFIHFIVRFPPAA